VRLEAVLANEDVLRPGRYPVRLQVLGPGNRRVFDRTIVMDIADPKTEPPFALPVFAQQVVIDGPSGEYRFLVALAEGGAATGGEVVFRVFERAEMPPIPAPVVLWGDDPELNNWLSQQGIVVQAFAAREQTARQVILVSGTPVAGGAEAFRDLAKRIARGSFVVFLSEKSLREGGHATAWAPLEHKGELVGLGGGWVYPKDEWARKHPIFDELPCGGLMDHRWFREVIPDVAFSGQDPPAEVVAGAINTSQGYGSGLMTSLHKLGAGRFILNTLRIRENLGRDPVAERLLRNLLCFAGRDLAKPLADLPPDFDKTLENLGYR
jgi:hypothetical protein